MVEIKKNQVTSLLYVTIAVFVVGCVIFYLLLNADSNAVPVWLIGGIVGLAFYLAGYLTRWLTAKKKTAV